MREWFTYNLPDFSSETRLLFIFKVLFVTVVITAVLTVVVGNNKTSSLKSSKQIVESRASYECWFFFVISLEYKNLLLLLSLSDEVMKEVVNKIKLDSGEPKEDSGSKLMPCFFSWRKDCILCLVSYFCPKIELNLSRHFHVVSFVWFVFFHFSFPREDGKGNDNRKWERNQGTLLFKESDSFETTLFVMHFLSFQSLVTSLIWKINSFLSFHVFCYFICMTSVQRLVKAAIKIG